MKHIDAYEAEEEEAEGCTEIPTASEFCPVPLSQDHVLVRYKDHPRHKKIKSHLRLQLFNLKKAYEAQQQELLAAYGHQENRPDLGARLPSLKFVTYGINHLDSSDIENGMYGFPRMQPSLVIDCRPFLRRKGKQHHESYARGTNPKLICYYPFTSLLYTSPSPRD